ncbi:polysaccharide deacetylase family protein [Krasilnikovia sp. MM14-A1259]|uniref:polysaccharide deacetylase family protein n=1 Tax=Krasilnikovia sp. MM14-A1259 TaxID=3373539 RepID=UPI003816EA93
MSIAAGTTRVTMTFDYEGSWGMPHDVPYDLTGTTGRLLELLDRHAARAVFFTVGQLAEQHPELVAEIYGRGHEVGLHGYAHEHMHRLPPHEVAVLRERLRAAAHAVREHTGDLPVGFRMPYLMGPDFYRPDLYAMLRADGYRWISNREIRQPEELFRPDRIGRGMQILDRPAVRGGLLLGLNVPLIVRERPTGGRRPLDGARWLLRRQQPFRRAEGLVEYPLTSPLDCDLLGYPRPAEPSAEADIDYAVQVLTSMYDRAAGHFTLNLHDWIIGTHRRIEVLDRVLAHITASGAAVFHLPGRAS